MDDEVSVLDLELGPAERVAAASLSPEDLRYIDRTILSHAGTRWRKVVMLVSLTMRDLRPRHPELTDVFYVHRLAALVAARQLEAKGNISYMRLSEVKLPDTPATP
jgi:hypothetical protein